MMQFPPELEAALLGRQVIFLRGRLDDATANQVMAQLLLMGRTAAGRTIELYIDSPGGSVGAALALHDVMRTLGTPVSTTCVGTAGGAAVLVLAAGARGRRFALPHARVHLADESVEVPSGKAEDVAGQAAAAAGLGARWRAALLQLAALDAEALDRELAAGRWLSADEAREMGLVDEVVSTAKRA